LPLDQPQLQITIADIAVPGVIFLNVESLGYFNADRFRAGFALGAGDGFGADFFAALGNATITIAVAAASGTASLITGEIDHIRIDLRASIATLSGRDLSARMIDAETAETFNNQTASQIAATLAARHGLTANVTATQTPVGQYYELDHTHTALGLNSRITTEWNLLTLLAQLEGFALGVTGTTLNFAPPAPALPVVITPQNMMALEFGIATTIPAAATVKSWNSRNKISVTQSFGMNSGTTIIRPNLTVSQAQAVAANHVAALARHGTVLTATMPGDVTLMPSATLAVSGTGSSLDQNYIVDTISRSVSAHRGFTQTVRAYAAAA
jgi:phage protein D